MDDQTIIRLFWQRDEAAIAAMAAQYGGYCRSIAGNVLGDCGDVEECLNDTWLRAWNAIPPHEPPRLALFLGKITRELAISRLRQRNAAKRGGGAYALALEELGDVASGETAERQLELAELGRSISDFLRRQPPLQADVFVRRYYHLCPVRQIAAEYAISESKVKSILFRLRKKLRACLESEGLL